MNIAGLTLVSGLSAKIIESRLKEGGIDYTFSKWKGDPYFKSSTIELIKKYPSISNFKQRRITHAERIIEILGFPHFFKADYYFYRALYKIEEDFNISKLDGKVTFSEGLLVESTRIIL